jgi:exonuclease SbcD
MKVLHTSDWHLGARLGRHDRTPDHLAALHGLLAVAAEEAPDLVVHTGDVFDATRPPYDVLSLGVDALRRLAAVAPTVVLCGNHDSAALLAFLHDLAGMAEPRRLWFVTEPQVLAFDDLGVALACVPFVPPSAIADVAGGDLASFTGSYADGIRALNDELLDEASAAVGSAGAVVYAAHLHVHGAAPGWSERRITVGDDYATHVTGLHRAVYAAFGHIHDPQALPGGTVVGRYAGSLIPIDFGEQHQVKQAVVVEVGDDVAVRTVDLPGGRPLTRYDGDLDGLLARAEGGGLDGHLLKARVVSDDPIPDLADQLLAASPGCAVFDLVNVVRNRAVQPIDAAAEPGAEPSLAELFREWRSSAANAGQRRAPDDDVGELLAAALGGADLGTGEVAAAVTDALAELGGRR